MFMADRRAPPRSLPEIAAVTRHGWERPERSAEIGRLEGELPDLAGIGTEDRAWAVLAAAGIAIARGVAGHRMGDGPSRIEHGHVPGEVRRVPAEGSEIEAVSGAGLAGLRHVNAAL